MKVVFQEEFGRVWTDSFTPYLFTLITQVPPSSEETVRFFRAQLELAQTLQKQFKEAYLISDFSETTPATREVWCSYYMELLPQLVKSRISYVAFVCPYSAFDSLPREKQEKLVQAPLGIYPTFAEALASVNLKRALLLAQRFEKSAHRSF